MKSTYVNNNQLGEFSAGAVAGGVSSGAAIGSVIPGPGTAIGAAVGGLVATIGGLFGGGNWWGDHLSGQTKVGTLAAAIDRFERASGAEAKSITAQVVQQLKEGASLKEIEYYIDAQLGYARNISDNTGRKWKAVRKQIRRVQTALQQQPQNSTNPAAMAVGKAKKSGILWPVIIGGVLLGGGTLLYSSQNEKS